MSDQRNLLDSNNVQFKSRVSSVLNKDNTQHGRRFMFDDQDDTAWSSDQGLPQKIDISFDRVTELTTASRIEIKFQGGFVGSVLHLSFENALGENVYKKSFYPDDVNDLQVFPLELSSPISDVAKMSILFEKCSDFFGRIIVYNLRLFS